MQARGLIKGAWAWTFAGALALLGAAALVLAWWAPQVEAASISSTRVTVTGTARAVRDSDQAVINGEILGRGETSIEAQAAANRVYEAVVQALQRLGVKHEAGYYALHPQWVYRGEEAPVMVGYEARRQLSVHVDDVARVGEVVEALLEAGINSIYGIEYSFSERERVEEEVLAAALRDARRKADVVAAELGMRVLAVQEVNVGQAGYYPVMRAMAVDSARPAMAPSPVTIDATVTVTYLLAAVN